MLLFLSQLKTQLCEFIEHSAGSCSNPRTLWEEEAKWFIRGTSISLASTLKSECKKLYSEIEEEIEKVKKVQKETFSEANGNILNYALQGE